MLSIFGSFLLEKNMTMNKVVVFLIDNVKYGIDAEFVDSIRFKDDVVPVMKEPEFVKGVIDINGEITPVYSLREKMGLPRNEGQGSLILVEDDDNYMVLEVDEVIGIGKTGCESIHILKVDEMIPPEQREHLYAIENW